MGGDLHHHHRGLVAELWAVRRTRLLLLFVGASAAFVLLELVVGMASNSLSLVSDSFHMAFDCAAMAISLVGMSYAKRDASFAFPYGYQRHEVLAAFTNACFLLFVSGFLVVESLHRLSEPPAADSQHLSAVAMLGCVINLVGVFCFRRLASVRMTGSMTGGAGGTGGTALPAGVGASLPGGVGPGAGAVLGAPAAPGAAAGAAAEAWRQSSLSLLMVHAAGDTAGKAAIALFSSVMDEGDWHVVDPVVSLAISSFLLWAVFPMFQRLGKVLLQTTPSDIRHALDKALREASAVDGVLECHREHFWSVAPGVVVGSLYVRARADADEQAVLARVHALFRPLLHQLTVQVEKDPPIDWLLQGGGAVEAGTGSAHAHAHGGDGGHSHGGHGHSHGGDGGHGHSHGGGGGGHGHSHGGHGHSHGGHGHSHGGGHGHSH